MKLAEELICEGESHTAEWFETRGLVDRLFQPGESYRATRTFIDTLRPKLNGVKAMLKARQRVLQLTRAELMDITEDWVDFAFPLKKRISPIWRGWFSCKTVSVRSCVKPANGLN